VLPLPGLALGNSVYVHRECMVGVQEGGAELLICAGIVWGTEPSPLLGERPAAQL
jgi:hypothetical protein